MNIDLDYLKSLAKLACDFNLTEIKLTEGDKEIKIKKEKQIQIAQSMALPSINPLLETAKNQDDTQEALEQVVKEPIGQPVIAPISGTFYRAPSPGAPPFCEAGKKVEIGDVLCIIESMKLMNEIESDIAGIVVEICVENAAVVDAGAVLMYIK